MGSTFYFEWEPKLMEWLQSHIGSFGTAFFSFWAEFGEEMVLVAVMCILYYIYDKNVAKYVARRFMVAACGLACIKNAVCRLRPYMVHSNIKCLKPVDSKADIYDIAAQGYSFPSGHAEGSSCIFGATAIKVKKTWMTIATIVIIILVGLSRFCLGVHYPTDVLGGWVIGIGSIFLFSLMERIVEKRWVIYVIWAVVLGCGLFYCTTNDYFTNYGILLGVFAADLFEEKFVKFEKPSNIFWGIIRMIGALILYFGVNTLLKLPFNPEYLASGTMGAHLIRVIRYAIVLFLAMGVYPISQCV